MAIIRSTYHGRIANLRANNSRLGRALAVAQDQASTGLRVRRASDDPGLTQRLATLREQQEDQQVYADNAEWGMAMLDRADGALAQVSESLSEAAELAIQMSSETYPDQNRLDVVELAQGMLDRVLESANAQYGDRYIFAGEAYDSAAYDATGTYQGDTGTPDVPVADSLTVQIGFDGSDLLQGTDDVMLAMTNFVANLQTGTAAAVQSSIDELNGALDQVSGARAQIGNEFLTAEDALDLSISVDIELSEQLSRDTEVDMADSYTRLFEMQAAFEAALQVTASARTSLLFSRI
jgi:flagellar hook-associated protein 3 FlgL